MTAKGSKEMIEKIEIQKFTKSKKPE